MSQTHDRTIGFFLANNATVEQVNACIDDIRRFYGATAAPGVSPVAAVAAQNTTPAAPAAGTTGNVELDSTGLPWDERIHSGSRKKNNDGSWGKRKNTPDATIAAVTAELRAAMAAGGATGAAPALPAAPGAAVVPGLPTLPQGGPVLPTLPQTESLYQKFVAFIATQLNSPQNPTGRLTSDWVDQVIAGAGVPGGLANLSAREDLIPGIEAQIKGALGIV